MLHNPSLCESRAWHEASDEASAWYAAAVDRREDDPESSSSPLRP